MNKIHTIHYVVQDEDGEELGEIIFETTMLPFMEPKEIVNLVYPMLKMLGLGRFLLGIETIGQNNQRIDYFGATVEVNNGKTIHSTID